MFTDWSLESRVVSLVAAWMAILLAMVMWVANEVLDTVAVHRANFVTHLEHHIACGAAPGGGDTARRHAPNPAATGTR